MPGGTGQGELWTASWRWWSERPKAAVSFVAPRTGVLPGVWRVDASWETQTYDVGTGIVRERRAHGGVSVADWPTADLRYSVDLGVDAWSGGRRAAAIGGSLDRRMLGDRVSIAGDGATWLPMDGGQAFHTAALRATFRSSSEPAGTIYLSTAGI